MLVDSPPRLCVCQARPPEAVKSAPADRVTARSGAEGQLIGLSGPLGCDNPLRQRAIGRHRSGTASGDHMTTFVGLLEREPDLPWFTSTLRGHSTLFPEAHSPRTSSASPPRTSKCYSPLPYFKALLSPCNFNRAVLHTVQTSEGTPTPYFRNAVDLYRQVLVHSGPQVPFPPSGQSTAARRWLWP